MRCSIRLDGISVSFPIYRQRVGKDVGYFNRLIGWRGQPDVFMALDRVDLSIAEGERVALLGKNGSGKTTMLKVMAGILPPSEGTLEVTGQSQAILNLRGRTLMNATGWQNLLLRGMSYGLKGEELKRYVRKAADYADLGDFLNSPLNTYSAGMISRFVVSTLLSLDTQILLLDEWVSVSDKRMLDRNHGLLKELVDKSKIFVFASHSEQLVRNLCDRAVVMDRGKIVYEGGVDGALEALQ